MIDSLYSCAAIFFITIFFQLIVSKNVDVKYHFIFSITQLVLAAFSVYLTLNLTVENAKYSQEIYLRANDIFIYKVLSGLYFISTLYLLRDKYTLNFLSSMLYTTGLLLIAGKSYWIFLIASSALSAIPIALFVLAEKSKTYFIRYALYEFATSTILVLIVLLISVMLGTSEFQKIESADNLLQMIIYGAFLVVLLIKSMCFPFTIISNDFFKSNSDKTIISILFFKALPFIYVCSQILLLFNVESVVIIQKLLMSFTLISFIYFLKVSFTKNTGRELVSNFYLFNTGFVLLYLFFANSPEVRESMYLFLSGTFLTLCLVLKNIDKFEQKQTKGVLYKLIILILIIVGVPVSGLFFMKNSIIIALYSSIPNYISIGYMGATFLLLYSATKYFRSTKISRLYLKGENKFFDLIIEGIMFIIIITSSVIGNYI